MGVFQHHRYHTGYLIKEEFPAFGFNSLPEFSYFEGDVNSGRVVLEELNYTLKAAIGLKLVPSSPNNLKPIPMVHKSAKGGRGWGTPCCSGLYYVPLILKSLS